MSIFWTISMFLPLSTVNCRVSALLSVFAIWQDVGSCPEKVSRSYLTNHHLPLISGPRLLCGSQCWPARGGRRAAWPPCGCSLRAGHVGHGHDDGGGGQGLQGAGDGGHPRLHSPHNHPAHFHRVTLYKYDIIIMSMCYIVTVTLYLGPRQFT